MQMTVIGMFHRVGVSKGEWLMQTAAGSTLGKMVIMVAKHKGVSSFLQYGSSSHELRAEK